MSGEAKFSSKRPKGDAWGVGDAIEAAVEKFMETGRSPMIPVVGVIAIAKVDVEAGDDGPIYVPVAEIRRLNSLDSDKAIRLGQKLLLQAIRDRDGANGVASLDMSERDLIMSAFGGEPIDGVDQELDDRELAEDETLTDPDRLRRHLVKVHGLAAEDVDVMEMFDVHKTHDAAHDPLAPEIMPHDKEWWAWRDIVIRERAAELRGEGVTWGDDTAGEETGPDPDDETELRLHLTSAHDWADDLVGGETLAELTTRHNADHDALDAGEAPEFSNHPRSSRHPSVGDLDAAEVQAEDDETVADGETSADNTED